MNLIAAKNLPSLPNLKLAVIGHIEWMTFLRVDQLPQLGQISHGECLMEEPAGGGAVAAVRLSQLTKEPVTLITALGKDSIGEKSLSRLKEFGINVKVAWRDESTRKGISMIDNEGERAITVIGNRLKPLGKDLLDWNELENYDGVFVTATDSIGLLKCRKANVMVATPRVGVQNFKNRDIKLDALIGSSLDPDENLSADAITPKPKLRIGTKGALGGEAWPGGQFNAFNLKGSALDSYGCGDNFAAGVTAALAAGWGVKEAISLGCHCGAICAQHLGPYKN